jgi:hypothetical protein
MHSLLVDLVLLRNDHAALLNELLVLYTKGKAISAPGTNNNRETGEQKKRAYWQG